MSEVLDSKEIEDLTIRILSDDFCWNPREDDNLGKMIFFHGRYSFPKEAEINFHDYNSWDEMERAILRKYGASVILPVYLYDHSGLSFSVKTFHGRLPQGHAEFDSGRIGFIFVTKKDIRKEYGKAGKKEIERAIEVMTNEVEVYEKYANGESYRYSIEDEDGEELESCGGFLTMEEAMEDAEAMAETLVAMKPTREREKLEAKGQLPLDFNA